MNPLYTDAYFEHQCRVYVDGLLASGSMRLAEPSVVGEARAQLDSTTCDPDLYKDWLRGTEAISRMFVGRKAAGAGCSAQAECAPGNYCKVSYSSYCGVCEPRVPDGGGCIVGYACMSGSCNDRICGPQKNAGAGGGCAYDEDCAVGLFCRKIIDNTCMSPADSIGQPCAFSQYDCPLYSASCVNYKCGQNAKAGEACAADKSAPACSWLLGYGCSLFSYRCEPLPVAGSGMACGQDTAVCADGYQCVPQTGLQCATIVAEGAPCNQDDQCGRYGFCRSNACSFSEVDPSCPQ